MIQQIRRTGEQGINQKSKHQLLGHDMGDVDEEEFYIPTGIHQRDPRLMRMSDAWQPDATSANRHYVQAAHVFPGHSHRKNSDREIERHGQQLRKSFPASIHQRRGSEASDCASEATSDVGIAKRLSRSSRYSTSSRNSNSSRSRVRTPEFPASHGSPNYTMESSSAYSSPQLNRMESVCSNNSGEEQHAGSRCVLTMISKALNNLSDSQQESHSRKGRDRSFSNGSVAETVFDEAEETIESLIHLFIA